MNTNFYQVGEVRNPPTFTTTSTAPGVYLVHEGHQRPVEGTAVYHYRNGIWKCERHGTPRGTSPGCVCLAIARLAEAEDD